MSTRGFFTFVDSPDEEYHVYKHSDCYPEGEHGGVAAIERALFFAWPLPRFEADAFAAAFVCANKLHSVQLAALRAQLEAGRSIEGFAEVERLTTIPVCPARYLENDLIGGGIRLCPSGLWSEVAPPDIEYRYVVYARRNTVFVTVFDVNLPGWEGREWQEEQLFQGPLAAAKQWAMQRDKELKEAAEADEREQREAQGARGRR